MSKTNEMYLDKARSLVVITSITANAPDNDNATYSVTLEGTGALSPKVA